LSQVSHSYSLVGTYYVAVRYRDNDGHWSNNIDVFPVTIGIEKHYFVKDHLGSIKMTIDVKGNVAGYDDYYLFGMVMDERSGNISNQNSIYKFTGKERDEETQYDYFSRRDGFARRPLLWIVRLADGLVLICWRINILSSLIFKRYEWKRRVNPNFGLLLIMV
jgi:hypothetical protein